MLLISGIACLFVTKVLTRLVYKRIFRLDEGNGEWFAKQVRVADRCDDGDYPYLQAWGPYLRGDKSFFRPERYGDVTKSVSCGRILVDFSRFYGGFVLVMQWAGSNAIEILAVLVHAFIWSSGRCCVVHFAYRACDLDGGFLQDTIVFRVLP